MKVLVLKDGTLKQTEIENTLEALQSIVGGYIEIPYLGKTLNDNEIDIIINEEGKLIEGLTPSITIVDSTTEQILDVIYGNCIFASHNDEGDTVGLNDKQIEIVMEELEMETMLSFKNGQTFLTKLLFV